MGDRMIKFVDLAWIARNSRTRETHNFFSYLQICLFLSLTLTITTETVMFQEDKTSFNS